MHRAIWLLSVYRVIGLLGYRIYPFIGFFTLLIGLSVFCDLSGYRFIGLLGYWFLLVCRFIWLHLSVYRIVCASIGLSGSWCIGSSGYVQRRGTAGSACADKPINR